MRCCERYAVLVAMYICSNADDCSAVSFGAVIDSGSGGDGDGEVSRVVSGVEADDELVVVAAVGVGGITVVVKDMPCA